MRRFALIVLPVALQMQPAFACSIDDLRKIAADHLDRLPANAEREFGNHSEGGDGGAFQMFEGESGTPHSIVLTYLGETGQLKVRMSFLNRRDFVVVETLIDYDQPRFMPNGSGRFRVNPSEYYFFCDGRFQIPANTTNVAKAADKAESWKKVLFESSGELRQVFERIPQ